MRLRSTATAALITGLALTLTACGSDGGTAAAGGEPGTITIWARDSQQGFMEDLADLYNASHETQAEVTIIPAAQFVQKFGTAAASGTAPDVASIDLVYLPYFASVGALEDITDLTTELDYYEDLSPAHRRLAEYEDAVYALPFTAEASVLFYNKELFRQAGLDPEQPPTSYAEILDAARKITALGPDTYGYAIAGACGGCNVFEFTPHIWASGGDVLSEDGTEAMLDSPEVTEALEFYRTLWTDGSMPNSAQTDVGTAQSAGFAAGTVGMTPLGAFAVPTFEEAGIDFGVAPLPGEDGGSASFAGGDEIAIPSGSRNKEAAREFITWATGEEAQTLLAKTGSVPVRTDLVDEIYAPLDPRFGVIADAMADGRTPYSVVENEIFNDNNGPWVTMISEATFGGDIEAAQEKAQAAAQSIIDGAQ